MAKKAENAAIKAQKEQQAKEALEAQEWSKGGKDTSKKQQEEEKRLAKLKEKQEREALLAMEEKELSVKKPVLKGSDKVAAKRSLKTNMFETGPSEAFAASNLDDALDLLEITNEKSGSKGGNFVEKHPEKRMKSAYAEFEETELPRLKAENPGLRLSQLKQVVLL